MAAAIQYPDLGKILWRQGDQINPAVLLFLNDELIRETDLECELKLGDQIDIIPAIAGGYSDREMYLRCVIHSDDDE